MSEEITIQGNEATYLALRRAGWTETHNFTPMPKEWRGNIGRNMLLLGSPVDEELTTAIKVARRELQKKKLYEVMDEVPGCDFLRLKINGATPRTDALVDGEDIYFYEPERKDDLFHLSGKAHKMYIRCPLPEENGRPYMRVETRNMGNAIGKGGEIIKAFSKKIGRRVEVREIK